MQSKSLSKLIMLASLTCGMPSAALADSGLHPCSNRTLSGDYGFTIEGILGIPGAQLPPGLGLPIRGLSMAHYDGRGNFTQVDHIVAGFAPESEDWTPGFGTYNVNPDCTGTAVLNSGSNPVPVALHFVIVKDGTEIRQVVDVNAVTAIGEKVED